MDNTICCLGVLLLLIVSSIFMRLRNGDTEDTGAWTNDWKDNITGTVTPIDGHTQQITTNGRTFIISKDCNGMASFQETDGRGQPIGKQVHANRNNEDLAQYLKWKVNRMEE